MKPSVHQTLARRLYHERNALLEEISHFDADLQFIAEDRESELEEQAQEEWAGRVVQRLKERSRREIEEIDAALERISDGTYGICNGCARPIPWRRLRALPGTRYCVKCAREREESRNAGAGERREIRADGRMTGDVRLLTDQELAALLREHVRADGRVDMEELRIICRRGVAYLQGVLPSAAEHQILLKLVRDVAGIQDVVDRLQVVRLLWEWEDRSGRTTFRKPPSWFEPSCTEDVLRSVEEGLEYVPPVNPPPDEEFGHPQVLGRSHKRSCAR
jgi:RNA polymerase-binding protein DksA